MKRDKHLDQTLKERFSHHQAAGKSADWLKSYVVGFVRYREDLTNPQKEELIREYAKKSAQGNAKGHAAGRDRTADR